MTEASDRTLRLLRLMFGSDPNAVARQLATTRIVLRAVDPSPADEIALALAATLILRLDVAAPVLGIDVHGARRAQLPRLRSSSLVEALANEHVGFDSLSRLNAGPVSDPDLVLTFGPGSKGVNVTTSGWLVAIGEPLDGAPGNELAAAFAGTLGAIEAFKTGLVRAGLPARVQPWRDSVSLWDCTVGSRERGPDIPGVLDLSGHAVIGAGGVGSAMAWTLALLRLAGDPLVVDPDRLDRTNLNRHLTGAFADVDDPKAELLAALLRSAGCSPRSFIGRWQELPEADQSPRVAVVTVDDDATRRDVQWDMPARILNAGTSDDGLYRVSAHDLLDGACLACISRSDKRYGGLLEAVAAHIGLLPEDLAPYARSDDPLPPDVIGRATVDDETRDLLMAVPGREFLEVVCARIQVPGAGPAVSAPMLSAAPGVLLATSIVKEALGAGARSGTDVRTSVLSGPHPRWIVRWEQLGSCECMDPLYRAHYRSKWRS
jgi:hypothetical protein